MWAKFSSALKRPGTPALDNDNDTDDDRPTSPSHADVLAGVFEQHPNLSVFHEPSEIPFPSPSPPASPSKNGHKGMFKRSKTPKRDGTDSVPPPLPPKLSLTLPKKVKSSLQTIATGTFSSALSCPPSRFAFHRAPLGSSGGGRPLVSPPITPLTAETRFGSLRSILRDRHTPATGQSVRFFSRDAYKLISPDTSNVSTEPDEMSFAARLQRSTPMRPRMSAQGLFSTPAGDGPQTDSSNIFDLSRDTELPTIPAGAPLLDSAIEIPDLDADGTTTRQEEPMQTHQPRMEDEEQHRPSTPLQGKSSGLHDRSHSFSFGQTVFSLTGGADKGALAGPRTKTSRSRALSDTVFAPPRPETDIDDVSAPVVYTQGSPERERDPFGAHATAYYTPGTVPPTPPASAPAHARSGSREEDMIWSLRTQLALQSELCVQFEVDLGARDALVRTLGAKLEEAQGAAERRKGAVRGWRKRVGDLERYVHQLQDEVDRSREESAERSVMDEASGEALRMLHRRIEALERERAEAERREQQAREEHAECEEQLKKAREEVKRRDESERVLKAGIKAAKEEMEEMGGIGQAQVQDGEMRAQASKDAVRAQAGWEEERARLVQENEALRNEKVAMVAQLTDAQEETVRKESELGVLKAELDAQWKHTEDAGAKMQELTSQRDELQTEVDALVDRITGMEEDWSQSENRKAELENEVWAAKEEAERERNELDDQLRAEHEHAGDLTHALQEREDRLTALDREVQYARDTTARLEARIRQQEEDAAALSERAAAREADAEAAQEEMSRMKREHARTVNEQSRTLQEVVAREVEARAGHEALIREKAEADVLLGTLRERVNALAEEAERLRRQVHALQQESADKEVRLTSFAKQHTQDKDDLQGLNIALDSKQQELELLKRRMGVRGTAGNTPAQLSKAVHRRESSIFGTPSVSGSRPPSVLSDVEGTAKARKIETSATATKSTLGKSVRTNGSIVAKRSLEGAMGPPPSVSRNGTSSSATPTRIPSSSSSTRAPTAGPSTTPSSFKATPLHQRRSSTSIAEPSRLRGTVASRSPPASASESDREKENTVPSKAARRMSAMPA
ncbi:hypothetical protein B0H21DRAFT_778115 [Amylocystis lapponica]|nr:hypothetical protein B0H21DRAFT_778115 [Amylocystis lapponica]